MDSVRFNAGTFVGFAGFEAAEFQGFAEFLHAKFKKDTDFGSAAFGDSADFESVEFGGTVGFRNATFDAAEFQNSIFDRDVWFDGAAFKNNISFQSATFEKLASFEKIAWPESARYWHCAFDRTLFRGTLSLVGAGLRSFAAFDGAHIERGLRVDEPTEGAARAQFKHELLAAIGASHLDGDMLVAIERAKANLLGNNATELPPAKVVDHVQNQREQRLRELERGCRVLKTAFERAANKSREQMLYRFELQARRKQKGLPPGEALISDLYALVSDYGASLVRPFVALVFLILFSSAVFFAWGFARGFVGADAISPQIGFWQALDFSWANVFKPLSALSAEGTGYGTLASKLVTDLPALSFAVRALATLQSLLAIVLAFLFALAVRRRFQIS